jgi:hypothetical protein
MARETYIRGGGIFSYTTYGQRFSVPAGSPLLSTGQGTFNWNAGDEVIGLGGVFITAPTAESNGWGPASAYSTSQSTGGGGSAAINGNITSSLRMVAKFGTSPDPYSSGPPASGSWLASTLVPGGGNGLGSDSAGHGGLGSVILANTAADLTGTPSGTIRNPSVAQMFNGVSAVAIDPRVGRMVYIYDGSNTTRSWQVLLNVSVLNANYFGQLLGGQSITDTPQWGDRGNVAVQRGTNSVLIHDALFVPAPGAASLLALAGLASVRRRR